MASIRAKSATDAAGELDAPIDGINALVADKAVEDAEHHGSPKGRLVLIGPTAHADGQPMEIGEIPEMWPMFVGWCESDQYSRLFNRLQDGNAQRLALYGTAAVERHEVYRLKRVLGNDLIRGEWYRVCQPLMAVIKLLQNSYVPEELGGSVYC